MLAVCPGFNVTGVASPVAPNREPATEIEEIVTGPVPEEVSVTACVAVLFTTTPPNETVVALRVSAGAAAFSCNEATFAVLPDVAVTVTVCALVTEDAFAVKAVLVAVAGTVTELGTVTALLLLVMDTLTPPVGAEPDKLTVHESASDPVMVVLLQDTALTDGTTVLPVPLRLTVALGALLEKVSCPVEELALNGSN
jgi:hypothetical protein